MSSNEPIYRRNFIFFLCDSILFTLALGVTGSTTVIPDFVRQLTDSEILIGLSGNLFAIGYSLPQLFMARYMVRMARKKWWFVVPNIPVRFMILLFAFGIYWFGGDQKEVLLVAFFVCYSITALGDGVVGIPWADLTTTSLDGRWRARLFGITTASTGVLLLFVAPWVGRVLGDESLPFPNGYALLFAVSGGIFALSTLPGFFINELPAKDVAKELPPVSEYIIGLKDLLRADRPFRNFLAVSISTGLLMMAAPFYIGFATVDLGLSSAEAVPVLLALQTIASICGALLYTWLGANHNLLYIRIALFGAALLPLCALLATTFGPWVLYAGFLLSGLGGSSNLSFAYLNWVVGYAPAIQRPIYLGLFNTTNALIWLITPLLAGSLAQRFGFAPLFLISLLMAFVGLFISIRFLQENQTRSDQPALASLE